MAPYYALFSQQSCLGSEHDYSIFKKNSNKYFEYLLKTNEEKEEYDIDENANSWAILGDKAYKGPLSDTPGIRGFSWKAIPHWPLKKPKTKSFPEYGVP